VSEDDEIHARLDDLERRVILLESRASVFRSETDLRVLRFLADSYRSTASFSTLIGGEIASALNLSDGEVARALGRLEVARFASRWTGDRWYVTDDGLAEIAP